MHLIIVFSSLYMYLQVFRGKSCIAFSKHSVTKFCCAMAEWFIQLDSRFSRMTARDEKALEETVAAGNNSLEYDWGFQNIHGEMVTTPYRTDLVNMLQINTRTNYERRVLRFEKAGAHAVLSPFR